MKLIAGTFAIEQSSPLSSVQAQRCFEKFFDLLPVFSYLLAHFQ
jgi:hypothetical protein